MYYYTSPARLHPIWEIFHQSSPPMLSDALISLAYMGSLLHINDAATTTSTDELTTHRLRHCRQAGRTTGVVSTLLTVA